ncbi:sugar kinase [Bacillus anthracis]|uniref:ROK family protein n=1 Tax=Bacillus sp. AFS051223 TaxID=2034280 RepID=UPI000BED9047|nr:ROK family protein [Bacillus sp. AFS051223]PED52322.1 sugar kinase [Bacillus anthracis]PEF62694.1 sugar kinase [Bacillus anthracis]PEZ59281.1 sugar kinase [Bacillus anthracis]PFA95743.1 sugar kinase [Bacillus anthracis]PFF12569.1 sugar kinase [Bacillus anthracis]
MIKEFVGLTSPKIKSLKNLYSLVRKLGPVRINTLTEMTGYKHVTCARLLEELVHEDLIYDSGIGESSGGRKPLMYVIKPDAYFLIGVEITGLYTTVLLLNLNLDILRTEKLKMDSQCTGEYTLNFVSRCIEELIIKENIPKEKLLGIGVGVIDPIDQEQGIILNSELFPAGGWEGLNIIKYLEEKNKTYVCLNNGTNLAALAEYRNNYWKETDNLVFVSNDMGIRCGTILHGNLVSNKNEMAEAFGHTIVDLHGRRCSCGAYGCLHAYSSLPAIRNEIIRRLKRGTVSCLQEKVKDVEEINFHHILQALEKEDTLCLEVIKDAAFYFGVGLSNLILLLRPDVVICGGTLVPKPLFYEVVSETANKRLMHLSNNHVSINKSNTAYNIVAQGAGCMVLDYFTEDMHS